MIVKWLDADTGPAEPTVYADLIMRLEAAGHKLPPLYRTNAADPFQSLSIAMHRDPVRLSGRIGT
jgi:hypothetical protein